MQGCFFCCRAVVGQNLPSFGQNPSFWRKPLTFWPSASRFGQEQGVCSGGTTRLLLGRDRRAFLECGRVGGRGSTSTGTPQQSPAHEMKHLPRKRSYKYKKRHAWHPQQPRRRDTSTHATRWLASVCTSQGRWPPLDRQRLWTVQKERCRTVSHPHGAPPARMLARRRAHPGKPLTIK